MRWYFAFFSTTSVIFPVSLSRRSQNSLFRNRLRRPIALAQHKKLSTGQLRSKLSQLETFSWNLTNWYQLGYRIGNRKLYFHVHQCNMIWNNGKLTHVTIISDNIDNCCDKRHEIEELRTWFHYLFVTRRSMHSIKIPTKVFVNRNNCGWDEIASIILSNKFRNAGLIELLLRL